MKEKDYICTECGRVAEMGTLCLACADLLIDEEIESRENNHAR